jgi:glycosyltransferase involved in cell wall biosynthesis
MIIGGAQENTLLTVEGLAQKEHYQVTLVLGNETGPEGDLSYKMHGQVPYRVIRVSVLRRNIHPVLDLIAFFKLYRFFRKEKFKIVHTHSSKAGILGRFAAKFAGVPVVIHTIHGLPFHPFQNRFVNLFYRGLERVAAAQADKIVTVAHAMTQQALQAGIADSEKFVTIRSGMDLDPFLKTNYDTEKIRKKFGLSSQDVVIGKIARLFHLKGHEYLIEAASSIVREFPDTKFLLVGDGVLKEGLQQRVHHLGLSKNFIFTGLVRPEEIPELISIMDIVVHVSLREGLAKVLPQAMASGKPVISFDLDGAGEVIQNGVNGFLVSSRDTAGLTEAIVKLLKDPMLAQRMGREGRKAVDPYFRYEYMVGEIDHLYQEFLGLNSNQKRN